MQLETFNSFRKLWGKIYVNLNPGIYYLIIKDNYDVLKYDAKKFFILSDGNIFGKI